MHLAWLFPALLGLAFGANGAEALAKGRFFVLANRDPGAAVYREYQPAFYWLLVGVNLVLTIGMFVAAYYTRST